MERQQLGLSLALSKHPILSENDKYKIKYLNVLDYFVRKYSSKDIFSKSIFNNYKEALLNNSENYLYMDKELKLISKGALSWKYKKFKFFSYRFTLLIDCMFINAFFDKNKAETMFEEIKTIYGNRHHKKLEGLFKSLYDGIYNIPKLHQIDYVSTCWIANKKFFNMRETNILVTANMSAGKSTLMNAIVGKKVNKTQNDACTAKLHYLMNKSYEDNYTYEWDYELDMNANYDTLMNDNENNEKSGITVGTSFRTYLSLNNRICFIDTPGVNSVIDIQHMQITQNAMEECKYDKVLYILNGENLGTFDDKRYLHYVKERIRKPIIFIVNKLDRYKIKEDSIHDTLEQLNKDLLEIGFEKPIICPISAYAGYLAKMKLFNEELNEDEEDELELFIRKFKKQDYKLSEFYPDNTRKLDISDIDDSLKPYAELMVSCGVYCLENIIYSN